MDMTAHEFGHVRHPEFFVLVVCLVPFVTAAERP